VVSYRALQQALDEALAHAGVGVRHGSRARDVGGTHAYAAVTLDDGDLLTARIAAVADGAGASVAGIRRERHAYDQVALTAKLWLDRSHAGRAYERFTPSGPMALLPESDHYGLVWTMTPERAERSLALPDDEFLVALSRQFGTRVTGYRRVADRRTFPLALEFARSTIATRTVVLGNAAQALHPVAGQGFNLGLRDAYELALLIRDQPRDELGSARMLSAFARGRRSDRVAGIAFTHGLVHLFGSDAPLLRWPRGAALTVLDALPPVKRAFTRAMLFGVR